MTNIQLSQNFHFRKIFALFVIGNISITTPLIDKCKRNGIAIVVMTISLRPVFVWANTAEANYLLRKRQFDLIEPFRCIIDHAVLLAFNRGQFKTDDFHEYRLKQAKNTEYYKVFYDTLISHKSDFFKYAQQYYRCFMGCKSINSYPKFEFK